MHPTTNRRLRAWRPLAALVALAIFALAWSTTMQFAEAAPLTVCDEGCEFTSIQAAVQAAQDEEADPIEIEIAPGTYTLDDTLVLSGRTPFSLVGTDPATTIIQAHTCSLLAEGCDDHPGVRVLEIAGAIVHIEGLTIRHGFAAGNNGGGILIEGGSATIIDSSITGNAAEGFGGGIFVDGGSVTISNSTIADNAAGAFGGGVAITGSELSLTNSTISGNQAPLVGGVYSHASDLQISDSAVRGNSATDGLLGFAGGIGIESGDASITGSLITENAAEFGGGGIVVTQLLDWTGGVPQPDGDAATVNISNSAIIANEASRGGGIVLYDNPLTITDSVIEHNIAYEVLGGDAVYLLGGAPAPLLAAGNSWGDIAGLAEADLEALIMGGPLFLLGDPDPLSHFLGNGTLTLSPTLTALDLTASNTAPATGEAVTLTATLNQFDPDADPQESVATAASLNVRFTPDASTAALADGVATTTRTLTGAQTLTATVIFGNGLGEYVSGLTASVGVTWAPPPPPPPPPPVEDPVVTFTPAPTPTPTPTSTPTPTADPVVIRTNPVTTPVLPGTPAFVETSSITGGFTRITAPPDALPTGATLNAAAIDNLEELIAQAPPPATAQLTVAFVLEATSEDGEAITAFDTPIEVEFTLPADAVPDGATGDTLVLAFWNGSDWVEVEGTVTVNPDGSITLNASVDHFTIFSVLHRPDRGAFTVPIRESGSTATIWTGGGYDALARALPAGASVWAWVDGRQVVYRPDLPAFTNARFLAAFPNGIPGNSAVTVAR